MKRLVYLVVAVAIGMVAAQFSPAFCAESKTGSQLTGTWTKTACAPGEKPCPFIPDTMQFFKNKTMSMSNMPGQRLPYKVALTAAERKVIETRTPELKDKQLLLIKPNPRMEWSTTPMIYAYTLEKDELTLMIQDWAPAVFTRQKK